MNEHTANTVNIVNIVNIVDLIDRAIISIKGADAADFLQSLVSNDVRKLEQQPIIFTALLSPQGKFLFDFFVTKQADGLLLDVNSSRAEELFKILSRYKLRAKIELELLSNWGVSVKFPAQASENAYLDPRLVELGTRTIAPIATLPTATASAKTYEKHRLNLGIPDGAQDAIPERSFLLELGYEQLNGVSFNKGCYVGQEVTARSKHRGELNKHIFQIFAETDLPPSGSEITNQERILGEMRSSNETIGLAILRKEAAQEKLWAGGVEITARMPKWW